MMRALVGLTILAGCAFEHGVVAGGDDVGGGDDDPGMGSNMGDAEDRDSDGDGVSDLVDNCVFVGNPDQHDHDDDARGDACDGCPHLVDTDIDTDGDGVGNACDPRPTEPGDRIAFFEGFYTEPAWRSVIGANTWETIDGTLRQPSTQAAFQLVRDDTPNLGSVFVDARVRINALAGGGPSRRSAGIVLSYRDTNHYVFCGLASAPPNGAEVNAGQVTTDFWGNSQYDYTPGWFPAQMSGEWLTLQARTTTTPAGDTRIDCVSHRATATGNASFEGDAEIEGDIGLRTNGVDASFDYVFVVATPASTP